MLQRFTLGVSILDGVMSFLKEERRRDTHLVAEEAAIFSGNWFSMSSENTGCGGLLLGVSTLLWAMSSATLALLGDLDFRLPVDDLLLSVAPTETIEGTLWLDAASNVIRINIFSLCLHTPFWPVHQFK